MRKIRIVAVVLPLILLATGVAAVIVWAPDRSVPGTSIAGNIVTPTTTTTTFDPPEGDQIVRSRDGKSEITLPMTWSGEAGDGKPNQIDAYEDEGWGVADVFTFDRRDFVNFAAFRRTSLEVFHHSVDNFKQRAEKRIKIGGLPAVRSRFTGSFEGRNLVHWLAIVDGGSGYHNIIASTNASAEPDAVAELKKIVMSFREVNPT